MEHLPQHSGVGTKHDASQPSRIDPFRCLPLEIVSLVNDLLDPQDTERLRRVCRSWKVLSEALNDQRAIARHCSSVSKPVFPNSIIANDWFRRWLCFEQSIATGLARSAIQFYKIKTWDLRNDVLVVGTTSGNISVQALRSSDGFSTSEIRWLKLKEIFRKHIAVDFLLAGVFMTASSDVIVQLDSEPTQYLARITSKGKVIWFHDYPWRAVVVNSNFIYVVHEVYGLGDMLLILDTVDISYGTLRSRSAAVRAPRRPSAAFGDLKLVLSADETFIAIKYFNHFHCILDARSGQLIDVVGWYTGPIIASGSCWITSEPGTSNFVEFFWNDGVLDRIFRYTHETSNNIFTCAEIRNFSVGALTPSGGVDIGRGLVFEDFHLDPDNWTFTVRRMKDLSRNRPAEDL